jgi:ArsR family transcriptional regulator
MIPEHENQAMVFKAFCDVHRLRILEILRSGEKCTCKLIEDLDIGQSSISYHMKILVESGIVESRQEGKWTHYKISENGCSVAKDLLNVITTAKSSAEENSSCSEA